MYCHKCGSQLKGDAVFRPFCGSKLDRKTTTPQATPPPGKKPSAPQPTEIPPKEKQPSRFQLWWMRAQMIEKIFFVLGIIVAVILIIVFLNAFWEILAAILVIVVVIVAFVTGSKEDRSEIRRFILKGAAVLLAIGVIAVVVVTNEDFFVNLLQPGMGVRNGYLTQYSEAVTVEEAFDNFFDNPKWSTYQEDGYTYVVFTGVCEYLGERADARITFQITGEQFRTEQLDLNGVEQNDLILYAMLAKIYEEY